MNAAKKRILKTQSKWADAKVEVRSIPQPKGAGMFAKRDIKSGETIAFYPIVMTRWSDHCIYLTVDVICVRFAGC